MSLFHGLLSVTAAYEDGVKHHPFLGRLIHGRASRKAYQRWVLRNFPLDHALNLMPEELEPHVPLHTIHTDFLLDRFQQSYVEEADHHDYLARDAAALGCVAMANSECRAGLWQIVREDPFRGFGAMFVASVGAAQVLPLLYNQLRSRDCLPPDSYSWVALHRALQEERAREWRKSARWLELLTDSDPEKEDIVVDAARDTAIYMLRRFQPHVPFPPHVREEDSMRERFML